MRQQHNYSATIEGSRLVDETNPIVGDMEPLERRVDRLNQRKRSMPPAQVNIPLLDFSKLHK